MNDKTFKDITQGVCEEGKFERPRYSSGMLLTDKEFIDEQEYFLNKLRRHNRFFHGWGVVIGLNVSIRNNEVYIEPGVAIDCAGNEIYLDSDKILPTPSDSKELYVVITYYETKARPVPSLISPENTMEDTQEYSRILEGCCVAISDTDPSANHDEFAPGTSGCGTQHAISIAHLLQSEKDWRVTPYSRR